MRDIVFYTEDVGAHHVRAIIKERGTLILENLPFPEGQTVEVLVLSEPPSDNGRKQSLDGSVLAYSDPFEN